MKNKLTDLNNHLFAQLERLSDESVRGDQLKEEMDRARAVVGISREIIGNAKLRLDAQIAIHEHNMTKDPINGLPHDGA